MRFLKNTARQVDAERGLSDYQAYLQSIQNHLPASAFAFATAEWHYNFSDPRCPHDSWLMELRISEPCSGDRDENRTTQIELRALGAFHDRCLKLIYRNVVSYQMSGQNVLNGHRDWFIDEVRLSENQMVIHEIEFDSGATILIECVDIVVEDEAK